MPPKISKILFVEPPKDYWFLMGEYLPPPTGLLTLAAYLEEKIPEIEIEILDCQAERKDWNNVKRDIESFSPSIVAASGFTCNAYVCAKVSEIAKDVSDEIITIVGGQHFSFTAEESLSDFPEIDYIVRDEGEVTLVELIRTLMSEKEESRVKGLSFRHNGRIIHTPPRPLIEDLDTLPYPAYHLVEKNIKRYHFTMMAKKNTNYMILEGSRGCNHRCSFCTQWRHWNGVWRAKSARRIADEMEYYNERFDGGFMWLTDDNFRYDRRTKELWRELKNRRFTDDISWFFQARTDDIANNPDLVAKMREIGNSWVLVGVESNSPEFLKDFKKRAHVDDASKAMKILNDNDIFTQAMFVIGSRKDSVKSIEKLRQFSLDLDVGLALYTILTPYPGTEVYEMALKNGLIEDTNYAHYDMVHAIMPTETLSRREVQEELYRCYRGFYGSISQNISGLFSKNETKRRIHRHMAGKRVLGNLRSLI
ncbi:MAG: radical SAM protein [Halobacteriota archaeon]|nr:radical SAM protein [Halobacteriota archaeon]